MQPVVDHPDDLSAQWLSEALHVSGHPLAVSDVRFERVGSGQMGTTYRLNLSYDGPEGPETLIAKLAGEDEEMRALVAPGYAAEVGFYSTLAPGLNIRTPRSWYGAITDDHDALHPAARRHVPGRAGDPGPGVHRRASCDITANSGRIAPTALG